jgi:hypothetical protein
VKAPIRLLYDKQSIYAYFHALNSEATVDVARVGGIPSSLPLGWRSSRRGYGMKPLFAHTRAVPPQGVAASVRLAAAAVVAFTVGAAQAWAADIVLLPNPTYSLNVTAETEGDLEVTNITGPGVTLAEASGFDLSTASASSNISLTPNPSIVDTVTAFAAPVNGASAGGNVNSTLVYSFIIVLDGNPLLQTPVPITVAASGGMSFTGVGSDSVPLLSQFSVSGILDDQLSNTILGGSLYPGPTSWSDNNTYTMETGVVYSVTLIAQADLVVFGGSGGGSGTVTAYVDPTFALASGVVDPGQYSFEFSPGVGNVSAGVPEPSTWAMTLVGFAGLGVTGYRRRLKEILSI